MVILKLKDPRGLLVKRWEFSSRSLNCDMTYAVKSDVKIGFIRGIQPITIYTVCVN